jgi:GNAT superfamily N-acetyltransferase
MIDDVYLVSDSPTGDEFADLRVAVGWTRIPSEVAERALSNSLHVACLRQRDRLVGLGRIVGDAAMRFYIEDVAVVPELQGRTFGRLIMDALVAWLDQNMPSCGKTYLMAADGSVGFYEHYGFERRGDGEPGCGEALTRPSLRGARSWMPVPNEPTQPVARINACSSR